MLAKSCVLCCVSHNGDGNDHGVRRADTARAHARWRYLVALHEATDMLLFLLPLCKLQQSLTRRRQ